jgi:hypothetical protein
VAIADVLRSRGWVLALVGALTFLVVDSGVRMRRVASLTAAEVGAGQLIAPDSGSPSGYEGNQHDVALGRFGADGYHWIMQAQRMVRDGDFRVRALDYDGPPGGRSVHWSSLPPWWTISVAALRAVNA